MFSYDASTGVMCWREARGNSVKAGDVAGCVNEGYWQIKIGNRFWKRSRLAWAHYYGVKPPREIAHLDGDKPNDRIANLRCGRKAGRRVTPVRPAYPKKVYFDMPRGVAPHGEWYRARVGYKGRRIEREFSTLEKANSFVQQTGLRLHGEWWPGYCDRPPG